MEPLVEAARFWLPLRKESEGERPVGKLMLSIELVPAEQAALLPAGEGHAEPNSHPTLPPPPGQLEDAKIYKWLYRILGPKVRVRVMVKVRVRGRGRVRVRVRVGVSEREKVSPTSQPGPMLSHASRKSATGTFLTLGLGLGLGLG